MINPWFKMKCNLCNAEIDVDELYINRKYQHEEHHHYNKHRASQNNIIGVVKWEVVSI